MANIDINKVGELKDELEFLSGDDVLFIDDNNQNKFAVIPIELYDAYEDIMQMFNNPSTPIVKFDSSNIELSYDEYERIKNQILEAVEKTLMPKPEKLN